MSEYDKMKSQKEEILSRELQVICSSCGGTCIYKRENNRVVFTHYCTPPQVRERIIKLRKLAWPWIPARQGQITFDEWSELVRWVTDSESALAALREPEPATTGLYEAGLKDALRDTSVIPEKYQRRKSEIIREAELRGAKNLAEWLRARFGPEHTSSKAIDAALAEMEAQKCG